jgi:hypothetical protein
MNSSDYENLPAHTKLLAAEAFRDGYAAAAIIVQHMRVIVGDSTVDDTFVINRDLIASLLKQTVPK